MGRCTHSYVTWLGGLSQLGHLRLCGHLTFVYVLPTDGGFRWQDFLRGSSRLKSQCPEKEAERASQAEAALPFLN